MSHKKHIYLFIPHGTNEEHPVVKNLLEQYERLPGVNNFKLFYNNKIAHYSSRPPVKFCDGLEIMLRVYADYPDTITMVSMNEDDVFAILMFDINHISEDEEDENNPKPNDFDIYIELFCANQALPRTGEGTKLLHILEKACFDTSNYKIELASVPRSIQYYKDHGYHFKKNTSSKFRVSVDMEKNTRALSNWSKAKTILSEEAISYLSRKSAKIRSDMKSTRTQGLGLGKKRRRTSTSNKRRGKTMKKKTSR
jgi:hypothetical protein